MIIEQAARALRNVRRHQKWSAALGEVDQPRSETADFARVRSSPPSFDRKDPIEPISLQFNQGVDSIWPVDQRGIYGGVAEVVEGVHKHISQYKP
jgi:hypothetical protein